MSSTAGHQSHRGSRTGLALARPVKEDFLAAVVVVGAGPGLGLGDSPQVRRGGYAGRADLAVGGQRQRRPEEVA